MRISGRDTLVARLRQDGQEVSGTLLFDNYEKDGSSGTVRGLVQDSICRLVYDFHSEGMKSVMEVHFLLRDSTLVRGIGDMEVRQDTAAYVQPQSLSFPPEEAWKRVDCNTVPSMPGQ